ncbi:MAG: hypothetical protein RL701_1117 [Pseudomonadota bacterium]
MLALWVIMTILSALVLGFGLGIRHATDTDHVVIVSTLLQREPGVLRAASIAAWWGAGHTATFFGLGLLIVVFGVRVPEGFESCTQLLVALLLLGFGSWHFFRALKVPEAASKRAPKGGSAMRPVLVGVVHGLAGSAGIALLASTTIPSRVLAVVYLGLFSIGTVIGMVLLTMVLSWPIGWTVRRQGNVRRAADVIASLFGIGFGAAVLVRFLIFGSI